MMAALAAARHQRGPRRGRRQAERRAARGGSRRRAAGLPGAVPARRSGARGMFALPAPLERLTDRTPLRIIAASTRIGADWRIARADRALMFTGIVAGSRPHRARRTPRRRAALDARRRRARPVDDVADRRQHRRQRLLPDGRRASTRRRSPSTSRPRRCAARRGSIAAAAVNLEKALRLSDRLGGHLVAATSTASAS